MQWLVQNCRDLNAIERNKRYGVGANFESIVQMYWIRYNIISSTLEKFSLLDPVLTRSRIPLVCVSCYIGYHLEQEWLWVYHRKWIQKYCVRLWIWDGAQDKLQTSSSAFYTNTLCPIHNTECSQNGTTLWENCANM